MRSMQPDTILFVYNAKSGLINGAKDYLHKIVSPKTYACNLCALTYDGSIMSAQWKKFIKGLLFPYEFLHKDEFEKKYKINEPLPAIFLVQGKSLITFMSAKEINACKTIEELISLVNNKIEKLPGSQIKPSTN